MKRLILAGLLLWSFLPAYRSYAQGEEPTATPTPTSTATPTPGESGCVDYPAISGFGRFGVEPGTGDVYISGYTRWSILDNEGGGIYISVNGGVFGIEGSPTYPTFYGVPSEWIYVNMSTPAEYAPWTLRLCPPIDLTATATAEAALTATAGAGQTATALAGSATATPNAQTATAQAQTATALAGSATATPNETEIAATETASPGCDVYSLEVGQDFTLTIGDPDGPPPLVRSKRGVVAIAQAGSLDIAENVPGYFVPITNYGLNGDEFTIWGIEPGYLDDNGTSYPVPAQFEVCDQVGTPTVTATRTATHTPTETDTAAPTATPTETDPPRPTPGSTPTETATPTINLTPSRTPTNTRVPTATRTPTVTRTATTTKTTIPTRTTAPTRTPGPTATSGPTPEPEPLPEPTPRDPILITPLIPPTQILGPMPDISISIPTLIPLTPASIAISATAVLTVVATIEAGLATPLAAFSTASAEYSYQAGQETAVAMSTTMAPALSWLAILNPSNTGWDGAGGPMWAIAPLMRPVLPLLLLGFLIMFVAFLLWCFSWVLKLIDLAAKLIELIPGE